MNIRMNLRNLAKDDQETVILANLQKIAAETTTTTVVPDLTLSIEMDFKDVEQIEGICDDLSQRALTSVNGDDVYLLLDNITTYPMVVLS